MAVIVRTVKNRNYTVMSNYHLRDKSLSLKAKGLLSIMLSLPDSWDFSNKGLAEIVKEGVSCVGSTIRELEAAGYIRRRQLHGADGKITDMEYTIYEQAQKTNPDENASPRDAETDSTEREKETKEFFSPAKKSHMSKPEIENQDVVNSDAANSAQLNTNKSNTNKSNTKELNTDCNKYPPINQDGAKSCGECVAGSQEKWIDRYNQTISEIKEQIDYDCLVTNNDAELVNNIVNVMAEVMLIDVPYYTIEGKKLPAEYVRINYRQITYGKLEAFLLEYRRIYRKIENPKAYLTTALYNVPLTADAALSNRVNYDMYGV